VSGGGEVDAAVGLSIITVENLTALAVDNMRIFQRVMAVFDEVLPLPGIIEEALFDVLDALQTAEPDVELLRAPEERKLIDGNIGDFVSPKTLGLLEDVESDMAVEEVLKTTALSLKLVAFQVNCIEDFGPKFVTAFDEMAEKLSPELRKVLDFVVFRIKMVI